MEKWYAMVDENMQICGYTQNKLETDNCDYVEISNAERLIMVEGNLKNGLVYYYENDKIIGKKRENKFTKEQLLEQRINYILEYSKLEENKKVLESSEFSTEDEIKSIAEKMTIIEDNINVLSEKIKLL